MNRSTRHLVIRRAHDLAIAGLILGWMLACKKKSATPAPPPGAALAAAAESTPEAAPAAAPDPTTATVAGLEWVAARGVCKNYPDFRDKLAMAQDARWDELTRVVAEGGIGRDPSAQWLVLAHHYVDACAPDDAAAKPAIRELLVGFAPVPEALVDSALQQQRCGTLLALDETQMWPYEVQFARELQERDFAGAEVTRVLWHDTLSGWLAVCGERISRRQRVSGQTQVAKLERIIGLDDQVLIELRSKMLTALERGESDRILDYSRAITDREKSLDSRNADLYEQKLLDVQAAVAMQEKDLAAARSITPPPASPTAKADPTADAARKTANVAKTAKNVHDTVKTAKSIGKMFGL